jgi:hypothetical protein
MTICPLWGPLSFLRLSASSTALCPLYGPLFSLRPSVPSTALCPLYGPVPCTALCPLYGPRSPLKHSETSKMTLLFREMFCKTRFFKTPRVIGIYFVYVIIAIIAIIAK